MKSLLRKLTGRSAQPPRLTAPAATAPGTRVYAVGDIHGRLDLFEEMIRSIEADDASRKPARTSVVLLGDLIDRGPDSAGVVARARAWAKERAIKLIMGNHEEMFLDSFSKQGILRSFMRFGGRVTLLSYGVPPRVLAEADGEELQRIMADAVPQEDRDFIAGFEKMVRFGDYIFVHAGVRPDMPLERQTGQDCRWIREPFLSHDGDFGGMIVHGHTVTEQPELMHNRIGIDTGAFMSGKLTAIGLEGTERWLIQACEQESGKIASFAQAA
ncbi:serine/threonine protein phosphatase 1 [Novosphingobium chloroacetimidivorans]|uniref:Serine/threonine protein phosphatase 1 n=1 Tax=Novosphingobium chloroacetimidivorans TaxID=1428314 RepID=A0A7W7KCF2_9SPHN|nr:metallophosphoesterase family protein [Novosphingobium chloroacetimidivorans]MBB4859876.1 serine/threonine protein phosphatase 1 [Novosphingobium chloroacetimidivorans]